MAMKGGSFVPIGQFFCYERRSLAGARSRHAGGTRFALLAASVICVAILAVILVPVVEAISWPDDLSNNNAAIADNNLGLLAKACSETYCLTGISGLDLWMSFTEVSSL